MKQDNKRRITFKRGLYRTDADWKITETVKLTGIALITAYCFFASVWGLLPGGLAALYVFHVDYKSYQRKCGRCFMDSFRELMQLVDSSINAGYSLENAFLEAGRECVRREYTDMESEFSYIENGLLCNRRLEELLSEVGEKRCADEIGELAGLIGIAKRHGGNISGLIRQFNQNISRRRMLEQELDTMMAAKRFEGMIMVVMPYLIILYMRLTTPGYMDSLYETVIGRLVMTVALAVTIGALVIMDRLVEADGM